MSLPKALLLVPAHATRLQPWKPCVLPSAELELSKLYAEQPAEYSARTSAALSHLGVTLLMM